MPKTTKRISIALTKEDVREIKLLCDFFEETQSAIIKRAIIILHYITFGTKRED